MKRLTQEAYKRASRYIANKARPIERALFAYHFEGGPAAAVILALEPYQNPDGGFGQAYEPDLRTPSSSALATGHALRRLCETGIPAEHEMVRRAVKYALETLNPQTHVWRIVPAGANGDPHAPWWHDDGQSLAKTFENFVISPRGEMLAGLYHYQARPREWLDALAGETVAAVESITPGGGSFEYAMQLAEAPGLPEALRDRLVAHLRAHTRAVVEVDPAKWTDYCLPPVWAAPSPQSAVADLLGESIEWNLDAILETQTPEGYWEPNWNWFGDYPDEWEQARLEWLGELTLRNLTVLKAYGRID